MKKLIVTICLVVVLVGSIAYTQLVQSGSILFVTARTYPTTNEESDVLLLKRYLPKKIKVGESFEYRIQLTNLCEVPLSSIKITEAVETEKYVLKKSSITPYIEYGEGFTYLQFYIKDLAPDEVKSVLIEAIATKTGPLNLCSTVQYQVPLITSVNIVE